MSNQQNVYGFTNGGPVRQYGIPTGYQPYVGRGFVPASRLVGYFNDGRAYPVNTGFNNRGGYASGQVFNQGVYPYQQPQQSFQSGQTRQNINAELEQLFNHYYDEKLWINYKLDNDMLHNVMTTFKYLFQCLMKVGYVWYINYSKVHNFDWRNIMDVLIRSGTKDTVFIRLVEETNKAKQFVNMVEMNRQVVDIARVNNMGTIMHHYCKITVKFYLHALVNILNIMSNLSDDMHKSLELKNKYYYGNADSLHPTITTDLGYYSKCLETLRKFIDRFIKLEEIK